MNLVIHQNKCITKNSEIKDLCGFTENWNRDKGVVFTADERRSRVGPHDFRNVENTGEIQS